MKIDLIIFKRSPPSHFADIMCSAVIGPSGTPCFKNEERHCRRFANFTIDGVPMCRQHAGELCLKHMIKVQK
jgi:hypothetical protein